MLSAQMEGENMTDTQRRQIEELREQGYGYKKIANETGISPNTVKSYCRKLDVMSGLPAYASREGNTVRCKECGEPIAQVKGRKKKISWKSAPGYWALMSLTARFSGKRLSALQ